jgi:hypothetical protein
VPVVPAWLIEFFEIESDPNNPLDLSNPTAIWFSASVTPRCSMPVII